MTAIRKAAVAGMFYPGSATTLRAEVEGYLSAASQTAAPVPKAIIAPHAGYRYSGAIAATAYARIAPASDTIKRVILLGPCHRVAVRGLALSGADYFETPLGKVEIDHEAEDLVNGLPGVAAFPPTHEQEHALEVHIPFLQVLLNDFKLVPIVVGEAPPEQVAAVLDKLWGGSETLIVISSDLSHYLEYDAARDIDSRTASAITSFAPEKIERGGACGRFPVGGLLHLAKSKELTCEQLDLRNSGDTAGTKDRVVGYGSWAFYEPGAQPAAAKPKPKAKPLNIRLVRKPAPAQQKSQPQTANDFEAATKKLLVDFGPKLLEIADTSIRLGLKTGKPLAIDPAKQPAAIAAQGACFVTLKTGTGQLRGCIGSPAAYRQLCIDVAENAFRAAFKDPRFKPVTAAEYETLKMSISVLSPQAGMTFKDEADLLGQLRPGIDGLVIADGPRRALFLPSVWEQLPDPKTFLAHLKHKAGMPQNHWSATFKANRFIAEEIHAKK